MKWYLILLIIAIGVIVTFLSLSYLLSISEYPPVVDPLKGDLATSNALNTSIDPHDINAQILVNTTYTNGIKGYLTNEFPAGVVSTHLIITARSPGNSTLTLVVNGTYVFRDMAFANITTDNFIIPASTTNISFLITIHSTEMNYTRAFHYTGIVYTPVQFINYANSLTKTKPTTSSTTGQAYGYLLALAGALGGMGIPLAKYARWQSNTHPDFSKYEV